MDERAAALAETGRDERCPASGAEGGDDEHAATAAADDARQARMDRVAVLYAEITAATREFLRAVAECDRHRDWAGEGFGSCAEWLAWRLGVTRNTANEKVRAARALEDLPLISDAMARGEVSFSKVRALTRAATRENEAELLTYARAARRSTRSPGLERKAVSRMHRGGLGRARHVAVARAPPVAHAFHPAARPVR
jgi:hypothetical protein